MLVTVTDPSRREHEAVGLLTESLPMYNGGNKVPHNLPSPDGRCVRSRMETVWILRLVRRRKRMGRGAAAEIRPEELVLHLGRIGGGTALAARGTESLVIQGERKW